MDRNNLKTRQAGQQKKGGKGREGSGDRGLVVMATELIVVETFNLKEINDSSGFFFFPFSNRVTQSHDKREREKPDSVYKCQNERVGHKGMQDRLKHSNPAHWETNAEGDLSS